MSANEKTWPNEKAFKDVKAELTKGLPITFEMVGRVFGPDFWMLQVYALMDAQDAARAIAGAINRLAKGDSGIIGEAKSN